MARQRHRIRLARLIGLLIIATIGCVLGGMWIWNTYLVGERSTEAQNNPFVNRRSNAPDTAPPHPLDPILQRAVKSLEHHRLQHHSYTATMIKQERIAGKLAPENRILLKLRYRLAPSQSQSISQVPSNEAPSIETGSRPMDVYLKFLEPKSLAGREVIWKQGENDNRLIVHEVGLLNLARIPLAPTSGLAMMGNKYPITDIGIEKLIEKLIEKGERDRALGDCQISPTQEVTIAGRQCERFEIIHPEPTNNHDGQEISHEFYRAVVDIDIEHQIPIHYAAYQWPRRGNEAELDEEYTYSDLKLNVPLNDSDFDPDNSDYDYP